MGRPDWRENHRDIVSPELKLRPLPKDYMDIPRVSHQTEIKQDFLIGELIQLSVNRLAKMFDKGKGLFCYTVRRTNNGLCNKGISLRYTIISLLGLHRFEAQGGRFPIDIESTLARFLKNVDAIDNLGDIGLLIWLCALVSPDRLEKLFSNPSIRQSLDKYPDARQGKTTEIAWFLAGLSHSALAQGQSAGDLRDLSIKTLEMLKRNYGAKGIFGHTNKSSLAGILRGRIGCFADQVYPIYALSMFAKAYGNQEALKIAVNCAEAICRVQGPFGQWWWHYDRVTGKVIGRYPVYSVHQDAMAPMALFALSEVTGMNFEAFMYKGLEWITGNNELDFNLMDTSQNVIWRSFYREKYKNYYDEVLALIRFSANKRDHNDLKILFECRPYHLGWLLYAFADKRLNRAISTSEGLHA
jgi:hypothetical protein